MLGTRQTTTNLSLTSSTSLDSYSSHDSCSIDGEAQNSLHNHGSSNNNHRVAKPSIYQQAASKLKQRRMVGGTKTCDGGVSKITASYETTASSPFEISHAANNCGTKLPSSILKYMKKIEGGSIVNEENVAVAYDATATLNTNAIASAVADETTIKTTISPKENDTVQVAVQQSNTKLRASKHPSSRLSSSEEKNNVVDSHSVTSIPPLSPQEDQKQSASASAEEKTRRSKRVKALARMRKMNNDKMMKQQEIHPQQQQAEVVKETNTADGIELSNYQVTNSKETAIAKEDTATKHPRGQKQHEQHHEYHGYSNSFAKYIYFNSAETSTMRDSNSTKEALAAKEDTMAYHNEIRTPKPRCAPTSKIIGGDFAKFVYK